MDSPEFHYSRYEVGPNISNPHAIILRSANLHKAEIPDSVLAVARAGSGTNNIPIENLTKRGIPVFNTPGANANSVKELVLAGMFMATRNIAEALAFTNDLKGTDEEISTAVEKEKKRFSGQELAGRTIGIIGLGNIGGNLANACISLGMEVIGYDSYMTVDRAWNLSPQIEKAPHLDELFRLSKDFITVHVPLTDETKNMINSKSIHKMYPGITILNFARAGIINEKDISESLSNGTIHTYVCDFPSNALQKFGPRRVIALPHLGASTRNAEDNCANMAIRQIRDYLENGNIKNSINFPEIDMSRTRMSGDLRYSIVHKNIPNMLAQISTALGEMNINILDMINKSKDTIAYTLVHTDKILSTKELQKIPGVLSVRCL